MMATSTLPTSNAISVILEKTIFTGGDTVRGYVCLQLAKNLKSRKTSVQVKGIEHTQYVRASMPILVVACITALTQPCVLRCRWEVQRGKSTHTVDNIYTSTYE